jgi:hypothetical protein
MNMAMLRYGVLLSLLPLLSACSFQDARVRVGALVLIPALLVIAVMWLLNRRSGEEKWDEEHYPDSDEDDDREDHHLM